MAILYCDPSIPNHVSLRCGEVVRDLHKPKADELLRAITAFSNVDGFALVNAAQSFTLIRVLATIANALAYSKKIQLYMGTEHDLVPVQQIIPHYNKDAV